MSTFDSIQKKIQEEIKSKNILETVADKGGITKVKVGVKGTVASLPGTEVVSLDASTFQLMECIANAKGREKPRYCIVEKGKHAQYGNQYVTASDERAHIITRDVYFLLLAVLNGASKTIIDLSEKLDRAEETRDLYKLTIDGFRKNGIID